MIIYPNSHQIDAFSTFCHPENIEICGQKMMQYFIWRIYEDRLRKIVMIYILYIMKLVKKIILF